MRKLLRFLVLVALSALPNIAFAYYCANCGETTDDREELCEHYFCSDCVYEVDEHCHYCGACGAQTDVCVHNCCVDCATEYEDHCQECGVCNESEQICGDCGYCYDCAYLLDKHCIRCELCDDGGVNVCEVCFICEECWTLEDHCINCGGCTMEVGLVCYGCGMCKECQNDEWWHCRMCGVCCEDEGGLFECCGFCAACSYENDIHCMECGACSEQDHAICNECILCEDCSRGYHCQNCPNNCFGEDGCCYTCEMCPDCQEELTHCLACDLCGGPSGDDICQECRMCIPCGKEFETHCITCSECKPDQICPECNLCYDCAINEFRHCEGCLECFDEVCSTCYLCEDCVIEFSSHCFMCHTNHLEDGCCEECTVCDECVELNMLHCQDCGVCGLTTDLCEDCYMCSSCAGANHFHCEECDNCFESEGGVCEECDYCEECALSNGVHCPECLKHDDDLCDECGYCEDCAQSEGYHCPMCEQCKADDMCEGGGEHCRECCEENEWICENCDICVESANTEKCEYCDLCLECCMNASEDARCEHNICVESPEWEEHRCDEHDGCKSVCEAKHEKDKDFEVPVHVHQYGKDNICSICKQTKSGVPNIIRQPKDVKCVVPNPSAEEASHDTVTFSVAVSSLSDVTYQWYTCLEDGQEATAIENDVDDGKTYVNGAGTSQLSVTIPFDACHVNHYYYCEVENAEGKAVSEKALVKASHGIGWKSNSNLPNMIEEDKKVVTIQIGSGAKMTINRYVYSDYHYRMCPGEGCTLFTDTVKAKHHYGDWVISTKPTEKKAGARYRTCLDCGEKFWQQLDQMPVEGEPYITLQPKSVNCPADHSGLIEHDPDYARQTITFNLEAKGDGELKYQWYHYVGESFSSGGKITTKYTSTKIEDDKNYVEGGDTEMSMYVPRWACKDYHAVYCVVSNSKGTVTSDTVEINATHKYQPMDWLAWDYSTITDEVESRQITINKMYPTSTNQTRVWYSDHHVTFCIGCGDYREKSKQIHTFGDWVISVKPSATSEGSMYKTCTLCGMQYWENLPKGTGPVVLNHPADIKCKSTAYDYSTGKLDTANIVSFSIKAISIPGNPLTYQWQSRVIDGDDKWTNISDVYDIESRTIQMGSKSNEFSLLVPSGACDKNATHWEYRCAITDTKTKAVTYTNAARLEANHNYKWMVPKQFQDKFPYQRYFKYDSLNKEQQPYKLTDIIGDGHYNHSYVCSDYSCNGYINGKKNLDHDYSKCSYKYVELPTVKKAGTIERYCPICTHTDTSLFYSMHGNSQLQTGHEDAYIVPADIARVISTGKYEDHTLLNLYIESGFSNTVLFPRLYVVSPNGVEGLVELSGAIKDGKYYSVVNRLYKFRGDTISRLYKEDGFTKTISAGYILTNDTSYVHATNMIEGTLSTTTAVEPYEGERDFQFQINGEWITATFQKVPSAVNDAYNHYVCENMQVMLAKNCVIFDGMSIPVKLKSSGIAMGTFVVGKSRVSQPEIWVVTESGDTVRFNRAYDITGSQNVLPDGSITWSGNTITMKEGLNLQALHIGSTEKYTLLHRGNTICNKTLKGDPTAIYAAGELEIKAWNGYTLTVTSKNGTAIDAKKLTLNQTQTNKKWSLNCTGNQYAIHTDTFDYQGYIEMKAKCSNLGVAALSPCNIVNGNFKNTYVYSPFQRVDAVEDAFSVIDSREESHWAKEFATYLDPKIHCAKNALTFTDFEGGEVTSVSPCVKSGSMKYNPISHTLTINNITISNKNLGKTYAKELPFYFDRTPVDTIYVRVVGENLIEDVASKRSSDELYNGAWFIGSNVKLIGDGTLRVISDHNSGIKLDTSASLYLSDQVKLIIDADVECYGISDIAQGAKKSNFVVGEKATLDVHSKGIAEIANVTILGNGEEYGDDESAIFNAKEVRAPQRIIYPGTYAYVYNLDGDHQMHFDVDGVDYDPYRFVIAEHEEIRMGAWWVSSYELEPTKLRAYSSNIAFTNLQENGAGTGSYDKATKTLYLNDYTSNSYKVLPALYINEPNVKVVLSGNCNFYGHDAFAIIIGRNGSATFDSENPESPSNLSIAIDGAANMGVRVTGQSIAFKNLDVTFGDYSGIISKTNKSFITIENCNMEFGKYATITGLKLTLQKSEFEDDKLKFDNLTNLAVVETSTASLKSGEFKIVRSEGEPLNVDDITITEGEGIDFNQPVYDILGRRKMIDRDYQGVVIQNGRKYLLNGK